MAGKLVMWPFLLPFARFQQPFICNIRFRLPSRYRNLRLFPENAQASGSFRITTIRKSCYIKNNTVGVLISASRELREDLLDAAERACTKWGLKNYLDTNDKSTVIMIGA